MRLRLVLPPLIVLLVAGGLAVLGSRWDGAAPPPEPAPGPRAAAAPGPPRDSWSARAVRPATLPQVESVPARVRAPAAVEVHGAVPNTPVAEVLVRAGDAVKEGQVVVRMSGAALERALAAAKEAGDAAAEAKARDALARLEVRSPADGVVHLVECSRGEIPLVTKSGPLPLLVLFDWRSAVFEGSAPAAVAGFLRDGAEVLVRVGKGLAVRAKVIRRGEPAADGSVAIEAAPVAPPPVVPEPGEAAEIQVVTGSREVLVVPRAAVREEGGRTVVHVVSVTEELSRRHVVVGADADAGGGDVEVSGVDRFESVAVWRAGAAGPSAPK